MTEPISDAGLNLIKSFEGVVLHGYLDSAGKLSVGTGHLVLAGEPYKLDEPITMEQNDALLRSDLEHAENGVDSMVTVPINENERAALISFAFNLGVGALQHSTLLRRLNAGQRQEAADQFLSWDHQGNTRLPGLTRRRVAERALFLTPVD